MSTPLWEAFLADTADALGRMQAVLAAPPPPSSSQLRALAGALFDLRASAALVDAEPLGRLAAALERTLLEVLAGASWESRRAPLEGCARALEDAVAALHRPDASGARLDAAQLDSAALALGIMPEARTRTASPTMTPTAAMAPGDDALWTPQVDLDMIEPFLEEAAERIEALSQKLLRLESAPGDAELIRDVFRDLHTLKGSSAFVGLRRMNRLAHAAEDLVGHLRDGSRHVERGVVDALLHALDGLRALLDGAARAGAALTAGEAVRIDVDVEPLLAELRGPGASSSTSTAPSPSTAPTTSASTSTSTSTEERSTLRVDFEKLDTLLNLVGELVLVKGRFASELGDQFFDGVSALDRTVKDLRQHVMKLRMVPIGRVFGKYGRTVRELAHRLGKQVRLEIEGAETELDKVLVEQLDEPLLHLVRNAVDHGIEAPPERTAAGKSLEGTVRLSARHQGNLILVEVSDDGAGIDPQKLRKKAEEKQLVPIEELAALDDKQVLDVIFRPGFSTAARVTDVSGRGVGMDIVRASISRLGGTIEITSSLGAGTTFLLRLPLTLAILQVLLVRAAGEVLAFPLDAVARTVSASRERLHRVYDREVAILDDGRQVPLLRLADVLELDGPRPALAEIPLLLVHIDGEPYAIAVDALIGKRETVQKTLGELLHQVPCVAGATLVDDRVAVVLDPVQVIERGLTRSRSTATATLSTKKRRRVLLAEDSDVAREMLRRLFEEQGCDVVAARDGAEALALAERDAHGFDLVSTDVVMPALDGYELTRALRAHPRHKDVPIVMVTSRTEAVDRVRGFDAGVDEYLTKPIEPGELVRAVVALLDRHGGRA